MKISIDLITKLPYLKQKSILVRQIKSITLFPLWNKQVTLLVQALNHQPVTVAENIVRPSKEFQINYKINYIIE